MSSSTSSSPTSPTRKTPPTWQERFQEACAARGIVGVKFELKSDMRGGRTAWAAEVVFAGMRIQGRYWFEGVKNAKEDAAEVALGILLLHWPLPQQPQIFPQPQQVLPYPMPFKQSHYVPPSFPATSQQHLSQPAGTNRPVVMSSNE
ncbi:hypothetical protein BGX38DRAFT_529889 [Terfezia claveryi]|nr:hypothetical protein BGX38DRAFT_529889 [Terfezia claveryi]